MKKRIKLTESQLHRLVKESVKNILREAYGEAESIECEMIDTILEDNQALEIADDADEGALEYFNNIYYDAETSVGTKPKHSEFIANLENGWELYHDYGAGYYFVVVK